jgi:23S rRNA (adenine-N6)-dimethyltransferase
VDGRSRSPRSGGARPSGQHLIRSDEVADELVRGADIRSTDHVVEIGAGAGRLTSPLARDARLVTAIELDPALAARLRVTFADAGNVHVVHGDATTARWPSAPWRAFGNVPFAITTALLRRLLDDPIAGPERADLILQFEAARKRAAVDRGTLLSLGWQPWWDLVLSRRIPRLAFDPPPRVDGGVLSAVRRRDPILDPRERPAFVAMLKRAFDHGSWPVRRSLGPQLPARSWKRLARDRGVALGSLPAALDVWDWIAVFAVARDPK